MNSVHGALIDVYIVQGTLYIVHCTLVVEVPSVSMFNDTDDYDDDYHHYHCNGCDRWRLFFNVTQLQPDILSSPAHLHTVTLCHSTGVRSRQ